MVDASPNMQPPRRFLEDPARPGAIRFARGSRVCGALERIGGFVRVI